MITIGKRESEAINSTRFVCIMSSVLYFFIWFGQALDLLYIV